MTKELFEEIILNIQVMSEKNRQMYKLGIDLMEYIEPYEKINDLLFKSHFNDEQIGWIDWYLYERPSMIKNGKPNQAWNTVDGQKLEICHTIDSLWETVCEAGQQADFDNRLGG